jgi:hypothetical protein
MSDTRKDKQPKVPRNNVAWGMILAGTGKGQIMQDRRQKRSKDIKRSWKREEW